MKRAYFSRSTTELAGSTQINQHGSHSHGTICTCTPIGNGWQFRPLKNNLVRMKRGNNHKHKCIYNSEIALYSYLNTFFKKSVLSVFLLLAASGLTFLFAENPASDTLEIGIIEHLNEFVPDHIMLTNEKNETVNLKKLIDKPTVLCFVYFECPMLCSPLMNGISEVIDKTDLKLGKDYQVLTIGFNIEEPLSLAIDKKKNYVANMKTKEATQGWQFFISDSLNIAKATNTFGFRYKKAGNVFLHSATLIFISPEGKITRYLNGTYFLPFEFKMAITESSKGISGPTINKILQFCYGYDSQAKRYVLDVAKVGGFIILLILVITVSILILKPMIQKRLKKNTNKEAGTQA